MGETSSCVHFRNFIWCSKYLVYTVLAYMNEINSFVVIFFSFNLLFRFICYVFVIQNFNKLNIFNLLCQWWSVQALQFYAPEDFKIIWLSNILASSVPYEAKVVPVNASCALQLMSTFLLDRCLCWWTISPDGIIRPVLSATAFTWFIWRSKKC